MGLCIEEIKYIHKRIRSTDTFDDTPQKLRRLVNQINGNGFYQRFVGMSDQGLNTYLKNYYVSKHFSRGFVKKNPCAEIPLQPSGVIK